MLLVVVGWMGPALAQGTESPTEKGFADARQLYDDGKMTEALAAFQKFESQNKLSTIVPQAVYFQGWCWIGLQRYREAIDTFVRLIKGYPTAPIVPEAILKQAECYRELKNYPKAVDLYRQFGTHYPKHAMMAQAMLGEAWTLFKQNDLKGARNIVQDVRNRFSSDPVASLDSLFLLGHILTAEKNYDDARQIYNQIADQRDNPRATEGFFLAGEAMFDARHYVDAITYYKSVQSRSNLLARIQEEMSNLEAQRTAVKEYGLRLGELRQLQTKFKTSPDLRAAALFRIANCYQLLGRPKESSVVYREFLNTYPDDKLTEQAQFALIQVLTEGHELAESDTE
jgi:TolA-binding protein